MVVWAGGCLELDTGGPAACEAGQTDPTTPDDCIRKECQGGTFVSVASDIEVPDDANPCTQDICSDGAPQHVAVNGTTCKIGDGVGECVSGSCEIPCTGAAQCDDKNRCTVDACIGQVCMFAVTTGADPDDMNPCTLDVCAGGKESHTPANGAPCGTNGTCNDMGVCTGCGSDTDCPGDDFCRDWSCMEKQCVATPLNEGLLLPQSEQSSGNCKVKVCQGGKVVTIADATDPFNDGKSCTADQCNDTSPVNPPLPVHSSCATPNNPTGMGKCDGLGVCLGCSQTADCGGGPPWHTCDVKVNTCFSCSDAMKNGTETDVDCGGECIDRCARGQSCNGTVDCEGECDNGVCVDCFDGVKNGTEGDMDCGGVCAVKCGFGEGCNVGADCAQGVCSVGICAPPACNDGVKNGTESDVDCGGSCTKCAPGKTCLKNTDCLNMVCTNGTCG
ncbi:hypothetical protein [Polyangium fumosum]|nr:hypothetical protein [Polyangium fumosum]